VEGDRLVGGFHGWRFGQDGKLAEVPLAKCIETTLYEISENGVDRAHFGVVHGGACVQEAGEHMQQMEMKPIDGHPDKMHISTRYKISVLGRRIDAKLDIYLLGSALNYTEGEGGLSYGLSAFPCPIDAHTVENVYVLFTPKRWPLIQYAQNKIVSWVVSKEIDNDVPIWENKRFNEAPMLSDFDGPIIQYRRWFASAFPDKVKPHRDADAPRRSCSGKSKDEVGVTSSSRGAFRILN